MDRQASGQPVPLCFHVYPLAPCRSKLHRQDGVHKDMACIFPILHVHRGRNKPFQIFLQFIGLPCIQIMFNQGKPVAGFMKLLSGSPDILLLKGTIFGSGFQLDLGQLLLHLKPEAFLIGPIHIIYHNPACYEDNDSASQLCEPPCQHRFMKWEHLPCHKGTHKDTVSGQHGKTAGTLLTDSPAGSGQQPKSSEPLIQSKYIAICVQGSRCLSRNQRLDKDAQTN